MNHASTRSLIASFFVLLGCDLGPESIGDDAPALEPGERSSEFTVPERGARAFDVAADGTYWISGSVLTDDLIDPEIPKPGWLAHVDTDGTILWSETFDIDTSFWDVAVTPSGVAFVGREGGNVLRFHGLDGTLQWSTPIDGAPDVEALDGDLVVAFFDRLEEGPMSVRRYTTAGTVLWNTPFETLPEWDRFVAGLAVAEDSTIWVGGLLRQPDALSARPWLVQLSPDGTVLQEHTYDFLMAPESGYQLSLHDDSVVLASRSLPSQVLVLDSDGTVSWDHRGEPFGSNVAVAIPAGFLLQVSFFEDSDNPALSSPWGPRADYQLLTAWEGDEPSWTMQLEDCEWPLASKVVEGELISLSGCTEPGTGRKSLNVARIGL